MILKIMHFILSISFLFLIFQCKKDNDIQPEFSCLYDYTMTTIEVDSFLPRSCTSYYWPKRQYPASHYQYYRPCFNPNNPNQIVYMRWDTTISFSQGIQLYTFDFCSGEKRLIVDNSDILDFTTSVYDTDWGSNDTIMYVTLSDKSYSIEPNGENKNYISHGLTDKRLKPRMNHSGSKFMYVTDRDGLYPQNCIIINTDGTKEDTIRELSDPRDMSALDWSRHNKIAFIAKDFGNINSDKYGIYTFNLNDTSAAYVYNPNYYEWYGEIENLRWFDDDEKILFQTERSICATTPGTNTRTLIRAGFDNRIYKHIDISPDGKTILTERVERIDIDGCYIKVDHALYLMNIDGTDERKIELPE